MIIKFIFCAVAAYLLGCVNAAYIYSRKIKNDDIRKYGSGNAGSTNILRVYGVKAALIVFCCDLLKGFLAVSLAALLVPGSSLAKVVAAVCVVCGHNWPCFMDYRGGKGVAASLGAVFALYAPAGLIALCVALPVIFAFKMVSLGALVGFVGASLALLLLSGDTVLFAGGLALTLMAFYQHRGNISRIISGTESKLSFRK